VKKLYFLLFIFCFSPTVYAQLDSIIVLKNETELLLIGKQTYFLEDHKGKMSIEDILKTENQAKFVRNDKGVFARPATRAAFWFKITVQNYTQEDAWLEVASIYAWYIDFYALDSLGKYSKAYQTGTMRPENNKYYDIINAFWLPLNKSGTRQSQTYYLRITEEAPFEVPLQVGTIRSLSKNKTISDFLTAGFVGIVFIMFLYNAFLYLSTGDHIYGLYLGYLIYALITITHINSYELLPNLIWMHKNFLLWHTGVHLFIGLFCIRYLALATHLPRVRYIILSLSILLGVVPPLLTLLGISLVSIINEFQLFVISLYLICLGTSYYLAFKGHKSARFYALGWTLYIISAIVFLMVANGLLPFNPYTRNAGYFGVALEIWIFSLALADRINILRGEKEKAQNEILVIIKHQKQELEIKVIERTTQIQQAKEEIETQAEELQESNNALNLAYTEIHKKNEDVRASINYARRIQNAILPLDEQIAESLGKDNFFILFKPKDIVSGDFYWFEEVQTPNEIIKFMVVADCTGHGVPGAFMSMIGNQLLHEIIIKNQIYSPDLILNNLHKEVHRVLQQKETQTNDGMDVVIIAISQTKIEYAGAMNPLYYVQNNELKEIKATKKAIGGSQSEEERYFEKHELNLETTTTFYLCSDGFQDQFGGENNKKFMVKNLKKRLFEISEKPMPEQKQILETTISNWVSAGNEKQTDDICVLGIRI
jgi:two-component system, sensor histidine kinase LadS